MKRMILSTLFFALASAAVLGLSAQDSGDAAPKIAVVDLKQCFDTQKNARIRDVDKELQALAQKLTKAVEKNPNDAILKSEGRKQYVNFYNKKKIETYEEIRRVVRLLGNERGYTLIEKIDPSPVTVGETSVTQSINARAVLYHDDAVDITEDVLKRLNEEYEKEKKQQKPGRDF